MAPATQYSRARRFPSTVLDVGSLQIGSASSMLPKDLICRQGLKFHSGPGIKKLKKLVLHLPCLPVRTCSLFQPGVFGKWLRRYSLACQCLLYWEKLYNIGDTNTGHQGTELPNSQPVKFPSPAEATISQTYCLRYPAYACSLSRSQGCLYLGGSRGRWEESEWW